MSKCHLWKGNLSILTTIDHYSNCSTPFLYHLDNFCFCPHFAASSRTSLIFTHDSTHYTTHRLVCPPHGTCYLLFTALGWGDLPVLTHSAPETPARVVRNMTCYSMMKCKWVLSSLWFSVCCRFNNIHPFLSVPETISLFTVIKTISFQKGKCIHFKNYPAWYKLLTRLTNISVLSFHNSWKI